MSNKKIYTEKNIHKLISSSLNDENRLDIQQKEVVLNLLLQKIPQQRKKVQPKPVSVIGLSILWVITAIMIFTGFADSMQILDLIKTALGLSMLLIPVSSIVLIILKLRSNEKTKV